MSSKKLEQRIDNKGKTYYFLSELTKNKTNKLKQNKISNMNKANKKKKFFFSSKTKVHYAYIPVNSTVYSVKLSIINILNTPPAALLGSFLLLEIYNVSFN